MVSAVTNYRLCCSLTGNTTVLFGWHGIWLCRLVGTEYDCAVWLARIRLCCLAGTDSAVLFGWHGFSCAVWLARIRLARVMWACVVQSCAVFHT